MDDQTALGFIRDRRAVVQQRVDDIERRLVEVRTARGDWTDEEHDPEGFTLTFEWQQAEGARTEHRAELDDLDRAEARIAAGTYGGCDSCGQPIPEGQLSRRPARVTCVVCEDRRRR